ncbi:hypothetical protein HYH03_003555 [Edaphochlamys debaryana]|uniref:Uncharacterized protein n=1 Tax=Edaphochlamys debaryana TaxID=47281 RepID=A0A836C423_9CHLO|nr:hypothetical protein HYH03_003555 [Edaphochlamys debaryana]|eukprot:KAG2498294.1 hypothetical protein HYH03_003555 [Edaphochlamys debaryana]
MLVPALVAADAPPPTAASAPKPPPARLPDGSRTTALSREELEKAKNTLKALDDPDSARIADPSLLLRPPAPHKAPPSVGTIAGPVAGVAALCFFVGAIGRIAWLMGRNKKQRAAAEEQARQRAAAAASAAAAADPEAALGGTGPAGNGGAAHAHGKAAHGATPPPLPLLPSVFGSREAQSLYAAAMAALPPSKQQLAVIGGPLAHASAQPGLVCAVGVPVPAAEPALGQPVAAMPPAAPGEALPARLEASLPPPAPAVNEGGAPSAVAASHPAAGGK